MADSARAAKLAQRIKVVVAQALGKAVKDPRVEAITVTDARVTNDLQHATIYYTVFGDDEAKADAAAALAKSKGVLRKEVGKNVTVRLTPTLEFVADEIPVNASNLEALLRVAKAKDAEVAALAEGKTHAGEADPYKRDERRRRGLSAASFLVKQVARRGAVPNAQEEACSGSPIHWMAGPLQASFACPVKPLHHLHELRRADPRTYPNTRPPNKNAHRCAATTFGESADRRGNLLADAGHFSPPGSEEATRRGQSTVEVETCSGARCASRMCANGGGTKRADVAPGAESERKCMMEPPPEQILSRTLRCIDDCEDSQFTLHMRCTGR